MNLPQTLVVRVIEELGVVHSCLIRHDRFRFVEIFRIDSHFSHVDLQALLDYFVIPLILFRSNSCNIKMLREESVFYL